jgi:hypothetical protein
MAGNSIDGNALIHFPIGHGYWVRSPVRPVRFLNFFGAAAAAIPDEVGHMLESFWQPIGPESPWILIQATNLVFTENGTMAGIG